MEWVVYLEEDERSHKKLDHYMAQIAAEIRMGNMHLLFKEKKVADMLLNFVSDDQKEQVQQSKAMWGMALGVDMNPQNN